MNEVFAIGPIVTTTKTERIAEAIQKAILAGKLKPGHRIVETQLAKELGVGNTAVREALFELESRGFVSRFANKGTFVTQLTIEDVEHIFRARREMEGLAAKLLQQRVTGPILDGLQQCVESMGNAAFHNNLEEFCRADIEFHTMIWRHSGNRFLAAALETMVLPLFAFFNMTCPPGSKDALLESMEQHARIVRAFRDGQDARKCTEEAVDHFRQEKLKLLFQNG